MKRSIYIILHILAVLLFTAGLGILHGYSTEEYGITWINNTDFEDSTQFSGMVAEDIHNLKRLAVLKGAFEYGGEFSDENTVVSAVTRNGSMTYTAGDLIALAGRFGYTLNPVDHSISSSSAANDASNYELRVTFKEYDPHYFENIEPGPSQGVMTVKDLSLEVLRNIAEYHMLCDVYGQELSNFQYYMNFEDTAGEELVLKNITTPPTDLKRLGRHIIVRSDYSIDTDIVPQPDGILSLDNGLELMDQDEEDLMYIGIDTAYIYHDRYRAAADRFEGSVNDVHRWLMLLAAGGILSVITLIPVVRGSGTKDQGRELPVDRIPLEAMVLTLALLSIVLYYLFKMTLYPSVEMLVPRTEWPFWRLLARAVIVYAMCVIILASVWRRSVNGGIFRCSLLHGVTMALMDEKKGSSAWNAFKGFAAVVLLNFAGSCGLVWLWLHRMEAVNYLIAFWLLAVVMAALDIYIYVFLYRRTWQRAALHQAVSRISEGETGYILPESDYTGNELDLARSLNSISDGLNRAINEQVKAERLKADLITNVSHDIRTPLTSIINYVDLIKREEIDNEKIREYVDVLDKKSARLKNLTEDLLEASKASSGNVRLEMTQLDMVALASQAGGEFEDKFAARRLELELNTPEAHAIVLADGRHLWRVFENLYNNAAKYALEGTRVYADVYSRGDNYVFTIKNTSAAKLNISPDELTERFVRGDASRSTEGSGLGLSIAKSLTKLMGGELVIEIDGDLYKASVILPKYDGPAETQVTTGTLELE
ncbi:MAG: HAMP domain-containing histidine kinase [Lachnospiraceae bacterium]|nr:HAMP domain-containing histidine kinase [Lachnospiraceae bacterium]